MTDADLNAVCRDWELPVINDAAGIDARWLQSFLALRIADLVAQVALGDRLHHLPAIDRAWFRTQAENLVQDACVRYEVLMLEVEAKDDHDAMMNFWRRREEL
jgi:hypothetical protein